MINCITPPEFTKEQIEDCKKCKHASGKKIWCCNPLIGVWIVEKGKILTPSRKIKYPSVPRMGMNFAKAAGKHIRSGLKKRTEAEQVKCMVICETSKCGYYVPETRVGPRCRHKDCGCCMKLKTRWATAHCPLKKW